MNGSLKWYSSSSGPQHSSFFQSVCLHSPALWLLGSLRSMMSMLASAIMPSFSYIAKIFGDIKIRSQVPFLTCVARTGPICTCAEGGSSAFIMKKWNSYIAAPSWISFVSQAIWNAIRKPRTLIELKSSNMRDFSFILRGGPIFAILVSRRHHTIRTCRASVFYCNAVLSSSKHWLAWWRLPTFSTNGDFLCGPCRSSDCSPFCTCSIC